MNTTLLNRGSKAALALVAVLLLASLVMDFAVISPRIDRKHQLEAERSRLRAELGRTLGAKFRDVDAARALDAPDLETAIAAPAEDPVGYLGRLVDDSGLQRLALTRVNKRESANLVSTEFNVRASGRFDQLVEFVRAAEAGRRLAVIEDLVVMPARSGDEVEGRLRLTLHDPKGR